MTLIGATIVTGGCRGRQPAPSAERDSVLLSFDSLAQGTERDTGLMVRRVGRVTVSLECHEPEDPIVSVDQPARCAILVAAHDTLRIPDLHAYSLPEIVDDSFIIGSGQSESTGVWRIFRFHLRLRTTEYFPLPPGVTPFLADLGIAPDGRHIAYVRLDDPCGAYGVVATYPALESQARTDCYDVGPTDMSVGGAKFTTRDSVSIYFQTEALAADFRWIRYRGALPEIRWHVDTIELRPQR